MPSDRSVVIVDAVRTPDRAPRRRPVQRPPGRAARHRPAGDRRAHGHRPERRRPGRRRLRQPGRRAELQRHPHGVARRRPAAVDGGDDHRHAVRLQPAGHQPGLVARRRRRRRRRPGLRRRGDEPHPDRHQLLEEARPRRADPEDVLRALRDDVAVRGRRAHRREVGHQPRGHRRASGWRRSSGRPRAWAEGRFDGQWVAVEAPDVDEEGEPTGDAHRRARRGPARDVAREAGHAEAGRPRGRRAHRRQLVADLRRRRRRADDDRGPGRTSSACTPRARVVDTCLVGVDPVLMLTGPIDATQRLLERTRPVDRRHRHVRDQRGVRLRRAGVGQGGRRRPRARRTPTAAPSPSATRSAPPARS